MSMAHHHHHHEEMQEKAPKSLIWAIAITLTFMVVEALGGWWVNSLALLSDAAHNLTDVGAFLLSLFAMWFAKRRSDSRMTYGYHRAEILGALLSGLLIWFLCALLAVEAVHRLRAPEVIQGGMMLVIAVVGLLANLATLKVLHHRHEHDINVRAAYLHVVMDVLGSVAAIVAAVVVKWTGWTMIDPLLTLVLAALMLYGSFSLIREAVQVLMESVPQGLDFHEIQANLAQVQGVRGVHDLHVWAIGQHRVALSAHLVADLNQSEVLHEARHVLEEKHGITHATLQIETENQVEAQHCHDCEPKG